MTINDIAWMMRNADRFQRQGTQTNLSNGSVAPLSSPPNADPSMDITGMTASDFKIIPVSEEVEQTIKDMVFRDMKENYGMSGTGNEFGEMVRAYSSTVSAENRKDAAWTLHQIWHEEAVRLSEFIESRVPGWEPGQKFDTSILDEYRQGVDVKA